VVEAIKGWLLQLRRRLLRLLFLLLLFVAVLALLTIGMVDEALLANNHFMLLVNFLSPEYFPDHFRVALRAGRASHHPEDRVDGLVLGQRHVAYRAVQQLAAPAYSSADRPLWLDSEGQGLGLYFVDLDGLRRTVKEINFALDVLLPVGFALAESEFFGGDELNPLLD
jgi:hypothetical protein